MFPADGACGLKPGWSSLSLCTGLGRWRGGEKGEAMAGEFGRARGEMGGGGAVTECQSNRWWLDTDGDEEREKEREDGTCSRPLTCSVWVCEGLSTWRCGLPGVAVDVGTLSAAGDSVLSCSAFLFASSLLTTCPSPPSLPLSSSLLLSSASSSFAARPGVGVAVPLAVWRACRFGRCRGKEKGTLPYPN